MGDAPNPSGPQRWRGRADGPIPDPVSPDNASNRKPILTILACMFLLAGVIAGLLYWIRKPPKPHFVAVWLDQYTDPHIAPNAWSEQDFKLLFALEWQGSYHFGRQQLRHVRDELEKLHNQDERSIVVYLSALAVDGDDGNVAILPSDAELDRPETWLSLQEILDHMRACTKADHKLLILDIMRPFVAPRFGVFADDIARRTDKLAEKATQNDPTLLVLTPCSPGQMALDSEELGHSVFAYYLEQGLSGAADGYNDLGTRDGTVSLRELYAFVQARVNRWAWQNREIVQTPRLYGNGDFALLPVRERGAPAGSGESTRNPAPPDLLQKRWQALEEWRNNPNLRAPGGTYRLLQAELLRAQAHLQAGKPAADIEPILGRAAARFDRQRKERDAEIHRSTPLSLAEAIVQGQKIPDLANSDVPTKLHDLADLEARAHIEKPNPEDVARFQAERKALLKQFDKKPFDLAWVVFDTAAEEAKPTPERLRAWSGLFSALPDKGRPSYRELDYLQKVVKWAPSVKENWPASAVHEALQAARAEASAEALQPDIRPWVEDLLARAKAARVAGDKALFDKDPARWTEAEKRFQEANDLYGRLDHDAKIVETARVRMEDALVLLPAALPAIENDAAAWGDWTEAAQAARELQSLLRAKPDEAARNEALTNMESFAGTLRGRLHNRLAAPLSADRIKALADPKPQERAGALRRIETSLRYPWLSSTERVQLWQAGHALAEQLNAETLERDTFEDQKQQHTDPPSASGSESADAERQRALVRAGFAIELLKLAGVADVRQLERLRSDAGNQPLDRKAWDDLRREVRKAWTRLRQQRPEEANEP